MAKYFLIRNTTIEADIEMDVGQVTSMATDPDFPITIMHEGHFSMLLEKLGVTYEDFLVTTGLIDSRVIEE